MTRRKDRGLEATADQALGEVLDFMRVIWALDHAMQRTSKRMEKELGVTGLQRLVVRVVGRFPSIPAGRLAELLHVHPSTLTGVLARLEHEGTLRRRSDPRDKRRSLLGLTGEGRKLDIQAEGTIEAAIQHVMGQVHPEDLEAAREVLDAITSTLNVRNAAVRAPSHSRSSRTRQV